MPGRDLLTELFSSVLGAHMKDIAYCKIFPPVGIARVGDSTESDGWFFGPDSPEDIAHKRPGFTFRDSSGRMKRQAALFRVYAFDSEGRPVEELTDKNARIEWTVSLANKKAAWFEFRGTEKALAAYRGDEGVPRLRNTAV